MLGHADPNLQAGEISLSSPTKSLSSQGFKPPAIIPSCHSGTNLVSELGTNGVLSPLLSNVGFNFSKVQQDAKLVSELGTDGVPSSLVLEAVTPSHAVSLDPAAVPFVAKERFLGGFQLVDLDDNLEQVRQVQAGGVGKMNTHVNSTPWNDVAVANPLFGNDCSSKQLTSAMKELPFSCVDNIPNLLGLAQKEIFQVGRLPNLLVDLPVGSFYDKLLPASTHHLKVNKVYTPDYFVALHNITSAAGVRGDGSAYSDFTPNHVGARISLPHTKFNLQRWRYHLRGFDKVEICQLIEFGFPVGLTLDQKLECKTRNHGSSYMWYSYVDKFIVDEVSECGLSGPFSLSPWKNTVISPLMTAHKKPLSRRTVFDATYGDSSVNDATPGDFYMGQPTLYTYPKVEDYRVLILKAGRGSFMWKRDLARFFLQLPMDPVDYNKVAMVWRGLFFFFVGLAFGLRHSGLNGQRVTDAVAWIHSRLGLETAEEKPYSIVNYVDDLGGVEDSKPRATSAYKAMGWLLEDLGLAESTKKAEAPTTCITYLGVEFDSQAMEMRVPPSKLQEIKSEIRLWLKRTTINKKELQSILGKLFWVSKVVKHSRVFLGRLLELLRSMTGLQDRKKVKILEETRKDILWWANFLEHYNGVEMITVEDPFKLTYHQLLDTPHEVCAGDATPTGGGAWHGYEYWCGLLPEKLMDPQIPIHIKEFWVLIVSAKRWGGTWTGRAIVHTVTTMQFAK